MLIPIHSSYFLDPFCFFFFPPALSLNASASLNASSTASPTFLFLTPVLTATVMFFALPSFAALLIARSASCQSVASEPISYLASHISRCLRAWVLVGTYL
jgi:hypothetical protein